MCASVPSRSVYSFARGFAAAMACTVSRALQLRPLVTAPLRAPGQGAVDDPGDAPGGSADMVVGEVGVALGVGMAEQAVIGALLLTAEPAACANQFHHVRYAHLGGIRSNCQLRAKYG